jgi:hypothetical protein
MQCEQAVGLLPWLLNGSLEPDERRALEKHLGGCAACRKELEQTRRAAAVYGAHLPSAEIGALAWERPLSEVDPEIARRHLESCEGCAEGLRLARESRALEEGTGAPASAPWAARPRAAWRSPLLATAACLALVSAGAWILASRRATSLVEAELRSVSDQLAAAEAAVAELRHGEAELRRRLARAAAPQLNLPVFELLPGSQRRRAADTPQQLRVPAGAAFVALVLSTALPTDAVVRAELRGADGEAIPFEGELRAGALGGYTLGLPRAVLPEGRVRLVLYRAGSNAPAESYDFEVRWTR